MQVFFTGAAKKAPHQEIWKQTFPSVQCCYLIIQITINQIPDLSSRFEKCVSSLSLCSLRYIKMEERTNRLIRLSGESYQSKAEAFSLTASLFFRSRVAVLMIVWE